MKIKLRNRLEVLMKDSGVASFEEMAQRLTQHQDYKTTRTSLSRKFRDPDVSLALSMIEAICNELQCLPGDLFETEVLDAPESFIEELQTRLQPFRYGTIRLLKPGMSTAATDPVGGNRSSGDKTPMLGKQEHPSERTSDIEAVTGPKVSHLHAAKLKK